MIFSVAVVDAELLDSADALLEDLSGLDESVLAGLRRPDVAGLIAAVQRNAAERDLGCRVHVRTGEPAAETLAIADAQEGMIVIAWTR